MRGLSEAATREPSKVRTDPSRRTVLAFIEIAAKGSGSRRYHLCRRPTSAMMEVRSMPVAVRETANYVACAKPLRAALH